MRITELLNSLEIGGAERMAVDLTLGLRARGHQTRVICLRGAGPLAAVLEDAGVDVLTLDKPPGFSWQTLRTLTRELRRERADVLHTHNPLVHHYGVLGARVAGVPVVVNTLHGPGNLTGFGPSGILFDAGCLLSDRVVPCCEAVGAHLENVSYVARRKATVIHNGIALDRFIKVQSPPLEEEFVFGAVGRLVAVKDHSSLLRAFAILLREQPRCRLEILGDGPLRATLERLAQDLSIDSRVTFRGESTVVATFLSRIHAFLLCSLSEGLPLTLLEAMAAGLPVAATAVGGVTDLVRGSGCGWLVPPGQPNLLADAMLAAVQAPNGIQMGMRGRAHVLAHFSLDGMIDGYERLFRNLLNERRPGSGTAPPASHSPESESNAQPCGASRKP